MYTFTFLITSTTFAVTELGHYRNVMGLFFRSIISKWKGNYETTSKCPFIKKNAIFKYTFPREMPFPKL